MHDLVIRGGTVVDGTGAPRFTADLAIGGDRIADIGRIAGRGHREIDADGLLVTPGWIDIHTHFDGQATWDPLLEPSFSSGVTTAILGNCGVGFAPVRRGPRLPVETIVRMLSHAAAASVGIADRGRLAAGLRADLNIVDFERLKLGRPTIVDDLPTGASRLLQSVTGYRATIVAGTVTREHDAMTGAMPGRLLRRH